MGPVAADAQAWPTWGSDRDATTPPHPAAWRGGARHRHRGLRLAVIGPSWHPLREPYAGGQESLVATLCSMLRARGHHVVLYARAGTDPRLADELVTMPELPELSAVAALDAQLPEPAFLRDQHAYTGVLADLIGRADLDVVLNHSLHSLPLSLSAMLARPVVTTLHTPPIPWLELGAALAGPNATYVAVSRVLAGQWTTLASPRVIGNGVRAERFPLGVGGAELVWVGRITPEKGTHLAIEAARAAGRALRLIGPASDLDYFREQISPRLGGDVRYLGHLDHAATARHVGASAAALVTPLWDEPFGLVAAEALMCGTPVVALSRGGLPEVVGRDGVLVSALGESESSLIAGLAGGVERAVGLDRRAVRASAVRRHSADRMVDDYEALMAELVGAGRAGSNGHPGHVETPGSRPAGHHVGRFGLGGSGTVGSR